MAEGGGGGIACCACTTAIAIFGGGITLFVFDIMALAEVSNKTVQNRCEGSNLWLYLLLSLVIGNFGNRPPDKKKEDGDQSYGGTCV
jgi:hypothetical protein